MAAAAGLSLLSLQSCSSTLVVSSILDNNKIKVALSNFTNEVNSILVRAKELEYDILVIKVEADYRAIYLQCSHENNPLNFASGKIVCNSHGSQFDLDGNPTVGPADKRLKRYAIERDADFLILSIT
jgi:nitrite reductase/ring-hydroxylating ferredoxin subunit